MRPFLALTATLAAATLSIGSDEVDQRMIRRIYDAALINGAAYEQLRELVGKYPGRLSGSANLERAVQWAKNEMEQLGFDRVELQPVMVPHWERGTPESVRIGDTPLSAAALGNSAATPEGGLVAPVLIVTSLDQLESLGADAVSGKIIFFNRRMDSAQVDPHIAYRGAVDQRTRGPSLASRLGAAGVLVRSMTLADDDIPHTGNTNFAPGVSPVPAAALGAESADRLTAMLNLNPGATVEMRIHSRNLPDAPSHNVIGELVGSEHPEKVILVGGHLDSWDIAPGAHDDGAGCVQSIEVLRLFKSIGYTPRHTIRVVLFTNEENGIRGATEYARLVGEKKEEHLLALETDSGGFSPVGFDLGNPAADAHTRASRWAALFEPYGIRQFEHGTGGVDVAPLIRFGYTVGSLTPASQRYFDYHHTAIDSFDKVHPRELALGAAAMAALAYLVDQHGL